MADREALRDFQRRLADRLQAAPAAGVQSAWLAVEAGGTRYLIPLAQAGEIFPAAVVHPVPYTQPWFLGVASLRGTLHGVVDLACFLRPPAGPAAPAASSAPAVPSAVPDPEAQWVTLSASLDVQCALRVDRLIGLRGRDAYPTARPPLEGAPDWLGRVLQDAGGTPWQTLDLQRLSQRPQFLQIGQPRA